MSRIIGDNLFDGLYNEELTSGNHRIFFYLLMTDLAWSFKEINFKLKNLAKNLLN